MVAAVQIIATVLIGLAYTLTTDRSFAMFGRGVLLGIASNVIAFFFLILRADRYVYGTTPSWTFIAKLSLFVLAIGLVGIVTLGFIYGNLRLVRKDDVWHWWNIVVAVVSALIAGLAGFLRFLPRWLYKAVGEIPKDPNFVVLLAGGNEETTYAQDNFILNELVAPVIGLAILGFCVGFIRSDLKIIRHANAKPIRFKYVRAVAFVLLVGMLGASLSYASDRLPIKAAARQFFVTSSYLEDNYVEPSPDILKMPTQKRNLIHIYMESVENSYYSRELGGYMEENLMPELAALSDTGVSFSNNELHGGPEQVYATNHSVAGMTAMHAGVPMLAAAVSPGELLYPDFRTIGDVLAEAGYTNQYFLAASASWKDLGDYFRRHGNFDVWDHDRYIAEGYIPNDYKVWWGVEDDKLYEYAKRNLEELGAKDTPFYMIIENGDTRFPDGYLSPNMKNRPFESQYANVIHYSQAQTVKLIKWIQEQPWYKDTTIVVTGDHRSMDKNFFEGWDPDYDRTIVNFILNPVQGTGQPNAIVKNRTFTPMDMFPTILSSIGVEIEGERLGLGTNMFSGQQTLAERDGIPYINQQFQLRSPFYGAHRETNPKATNNRE